MALALARGLALTLGENEEVPEVEGHGEGERLPQGVAELERDVQPLGEPEPQAEFVLERDGEPVEEMERHPVGERVTVGHDVGDAVSVRDSVPQLLEVEVGEWVRVKVEQPVALSDTAPTVFEGV